MDRTELLAEFRLTAPPQLVCADCQRGHLSFEQKSISMSMDLPSRQADEVLSPPDFVASGPFRCDFTCNWGDCGSRGFVIGGWTSTYVTNQFGDEEDERKFAPFAFHPSPLFFVPPDRTPPVVTAALLRAFSLYWMAPAACAASCREAVELLLTARRIRRFAPRAKGGRRYLPLHERLQILEKRDSELAEMLMAAKWIGNDAIHAGQVGKEEAVDALRLVQHALATLYGTGHAEIRKLAARINRKRRTKAAPRSNASPS